MGFGGGQAVGVELRLLGVDGDEDARADPPHHPQEVRPPGVPRGVQALGAVEAEGPQAEAVQPVPVAVLVDPLLLPVRLAGGIDVEPSRRGDRCRSGA